MRMPCYRWLNGLFVLALAALAAGGADAAALHHCDRPTPLNAAQQDKLLRFGDAIKQVLTASGARVAVIARSGLDLSRFGMRYSHAGLSLQEGGPTRWSVRQLYYACDEGRPRLYDQGLAGFLLGTDDPRLGYVSLVLLPGDAAAALERTALDNRRALELLGARYSANAYAFSLAYQNCNQWLVELLAVARGRLDDTDLPATAAAGASVAPPQPATLRGRAQQWLAEQRFEPARFEIGNPLLMLAGAFVPWLHGDDHPADDRARWRYRVTMPSAIEAFVRATVPGARRVELCHTEREIVLHEGWEPIADGCRAGPGDSVLSLE